MSLVRAARLSALGLSFALCVSACGPAAGPGPREPGTQVGPARPAASFAELEAKVLARAGVSDARLARRSGVAPSDADLDLATMSVIGGESSEAIVVDGKVDPFSFDARKKVLLSARALADALPESPDADLERTVLRRMLEEELARVEEERALPGAASALVFAMTDTLPEGGDVGKRDLWLARRLDAIGAAAKERPLADGPRAELDDALDPLEKKTAGYPAALAALSRLRDLLEETRAAGGGAPDAALMQRAGGAYVAHVDPRARSLAQLNTDAETLVASATTALRAVEARLSSADVRHAEEAAGKALLARAPCSLPAEGGVVRGMLASREREGVCRLLRLVAETDPASDLGVAIALLVLRDAAAMSRWIIAPRGSRPEHPFMSTVEMADARRLERAALSHPAAVLATMKAGELLFRASFAETRARAMAWERLGDLPLDLAAARLDATPAPASPRP